MSAIWKGKPNLNFPTPRPKDIHKKGDKKSGEGAVLKRVRKKRNTRPPVRDFHTKTPRDRRSVNPDGTSRVKPTPGSILRKRTRRRTRRRTGPQLSPNPRRTALFYRRNRRSRLKHRRDQRAINNTPQKKRYRRDLMMIRRRRRPGPQTDMSHKRGRIVAENRRANRGRGGARKT